MHQRYLFLFNSMFHGLGEIDHPLKELQDLVNESSHRLLAPGNTWEGRLMTYITGILINNTACHSFQFNGTIEKSVWRKGMYNNAK